MEVAELSVNKRSTRWEPMNPAPPEMNTFIVKLTMLHAGTIRATGTP
jgi:hypothetical protein